MSYEPKEIYGDRDGALLKISVKKVAAQYQPEAAVEFVVEDIKLVSSYNWLDAGDDRDDIPVIQVPGAPPLVDFPLDQNILKVEPDNGHHYIDQNAARMKGRPSLLPGLAACYAYNKDFRVEDYDVITDRNNLIKLFEILKLEGMDETSKPRVSNPWNRGPSRVMAGRGRGRGQFSHSRSSSESFRQRNVRNMTMINRREQNSRIDIDIISGYDIRTGEYQYGLSKDHGTMILTRWEEKTEEIIDPDVDFRGFGFSFLAKTRKFLSLDGKRFCEKGPDQVTGYHCLIEYKLCGLKMLVRYHADGCDMSREEFLEWVAQDEASIREKDNTGGMEKGKSHTTESENGNPDDEEDEDEDAIQESDTFDLLDSFKTLSITPKDNMEGKELDNVEGKKPEIPLNDPVPSRLPLKVVRTSTSLFPERRLLQVKTRSKVSGIGREKLYTQLFFSQTKNFFIAYHIKGRFDKVDARVENVAPHIRQWGMQNGSVLERLAKLLREIKETSSTLGSKAAIVWTGKEENSETELSLFARRSE
ncbi:hypothetical protein H072_7404 [Dactylellina haptotyla CBS 200.50]|uniref:Uncharacterized protein n=1 Tax=Dactylellina haptotyla (strain CBS 200.50) TaxID=1284197 RepID=S8ACL0_DACHA|nr:hypothetical protein H072_7404 [Dactylellina haptotyla CBS 200.50]